MQWKNKYTYWLPVILFIAVAIGFRLYRNSATDYYLLAGSDGPYLPVQVRSLMTHGRLAFPDMPLLFFICSLIAKCLFWIKLGSENECILWAIRLVDSFLPPLAAIPVFLMAKEFQAESSKSMILCYFLVAFSILNFTPLYLFSFQLQKNGLATVFVFTYLFYIVRILKYHKRMDAIKSTLVLLICVMAHIGSFGLLILISLTIFIIWLWTERDNLKGIILKNTLVFLAILVVTFSLVAYFDFSRFYRIIKVPLKIFEAPVLLFAWHGQNFVLHGPNLLILIITNVLALIGFAFLIKNRKQMETYKFILGIAFVCCALFLSNPFLGLEWASRLFMLAYIPITLLYLIIYTSSHSSWLKFLAVALFSMMFILSLGTAAFNRTVSTINQPIFNDLKVMRERNLFVSGDAIVARQSLRILANWVFETKGVDKYLLTKEEYKKYSSVYLLKQFKGKDPRLRGAEPSLGNHILLVYQSEYFQIFKLLDNMQLPIKAEKIFKGIRGTVKRIENDIVWVADVKTNNLRRIHINKVDDAFPKLFIGMKLEINGEWLPFSLDIKAETIKEIKSFDEN